MVPYYPMDVIYQYLKHFCLHQHVFSYIDIAFDVNYIILFRSPVDACSQRYKDAMSVPLGERVTRSSRTQSVEGLASVKWKRSNDVKSPDLLMLTQKCYVP